MHFGLTEPPLRQSLGCHYIGYFFGKTLHLPIEVEYKAW